MVTPYTTDLESRVIDHIGRAQSSIFLAVAWFTNRRIMTALIQQTKAFPNLVIQIVVDDNQTNKLYFFSKKDDFIQAGIEVKQNISGRFLHHKFMVIDLQRVLTGSYNYTEKANSNKENIILVESLGAARFYVGEFYMVTNMDYIDESIALLLRHPVFAQQLISAKYKFTASDLNKYRSRIKVGHCYLADNGYYDNLYYEPGFIFNPICKPAPYEFTLPIGKSLLKNWHEGIVLGFGREYYNDYPDDEQGLGDYMDQNFKNLESFYHRKFEHVYSLDVLEEKIITAVNIIIEDYLWPLNYAPFFNTRVLAYVMEKLPDLTNDEEWKKDNHLIRRNHGKSQ